ncbi:YdeI/OmpD-associated family protein [Brevibacillus daliensis]|uniref:YdeI/OmpD-associated family protein n=1 Tax=Brevibacillus daliensis TaxID=2892995 RepID=UPI001E2C1C18|nr:YdeI/OmpD-associated family protein [Brevibacillus daliensis]
MTNKRMNPKVDVYFSKAKKWKEEMEKLRMIILDCGLTEELKWYQPCYTFQNKNIVIISGFKEYCALNLFKGALLKDANGILIKPGEKKLDEIPALKTAFEALTPGRQRAYNLYFSAPKQSKTRESRVEKCMQQILNGKGLND